MTTKKVNAANAKVTERTVRMSDSVLSYTLERKRVKNLNLRITPDGRIRVSAPARVPTQVIEDFLKSYEDRIIRALARFREVREDAPPSFSCSDGDTVLYLGRRLTLRTVPGDPGQTRVEGDELILALRDPTDRVKREKAFALWEKDVSTDVLTKVCRQIYPYFAPRGIAFPELRFRRMVSQWGSCQSERGIVTFNTALAGAPLPCIELVAVHEFVHFLQHGHSASFYAELERLLPDWKERKAMLKNSGIRLRDT